MLLSIMVGCFVYMTPCIKEAIARIFITTNLLTKTLESIICSALGRTDSSLSSLVAHFDDTFLQVSLKHCEDLILSLLYISSICCVGL